MAIVEQRLHELGIELPLLNKPVANYVGFRRTGNLLYLSGIGPVVEGKINSHMGQSETFHQS